jgi:RNA-directed DNA polymerase
MAFAFAADNYWSSSEFSATNAWKQNFNNGNQNNNNKNNNKRVRALRWWKQFMNCDLKVSELFQAYYDCRKHKRNTVNALKFEQNLERNLMDLYYELRSCLYEPGLSVMFVITHPKPREVWAADFRDRIVHHVLYNRYSDYFYKRFIFDTYACIPEKGTLKASKRVQHFVRSVTKNHTQDAYFLKADIANFFVSINKEKLDTQISAHIKNPWWLWLARVILHKDPRENVHIKSPKNLLAKVPAFKSLLNAPSNFGLPIGNLSSQFFANIYLHDLDMYAKHKLKLKYYARYVDDIVAFDTSSKKLNEAYKQMQDFLQGNLSIHFHPNKTQINKVEHGINFVGYIIKPWRKYLRRSIINNMYKRYDPDKDFESLRATINSYFGMLKHVNGYSERKPAAIKFGKDGCWFDGNLTKIVKLGFVNEN